MHDVIRERILARAGLLLPVYSGPVLRLEDLLRSEWSEDFEARMRARLVMGALRYGRMHARGKPVYDRLPSIRKRLDYYSRDGNLEHLVDAANLCLLEYEEGVHPLKHWNAADDGEHTKVK